MQIHDSQGIFQERRIVEVREEATGITTERGQGKSRQTGEYQARREKILAWRKANKDKVNAQARRRKVRLKERGIKPKPKPSSPEAKERARQKYYANLSDEQKARYDARKSQSLPKMTPEEKAERARQQANRYYYANKEKHNKKCAERARMAAPHIKEKQRKAISEWKQKNKIKCKAYMKKHHAKPEYRVQMNLRYRLREFIKVKVGSRRELFGCTPAELRLHIESQFKKGMTWDNYGKWQIDHKTPCAAFNLTKIEERNICFNWQNLQPLWAKDNLLKRDKLIHPQVFLPLQYV